MRLSASIAVSLFLVGLAALVLWQPAFDLPRFGSKGQIGAGALPQLVLFLTIVLALLSAVTDVVLRVRRGPRAIAPAIAAPASRVLPIGFAILALLGLYLIGWQRIGFPIASAAFMAVASALLAPPSARNVRGYAIIVVTSVLFCVGVWLAFVHLLAVPLR